MRGKVRGVVATPADVLVIPDEDSSVSSEEEELVLLISSPSSSLETLDSEASETVDDVILNT